MCQVTLVPWSLSLDAASGAGWGCSFSGWGGYEATNQLDLFGLATIVSAMRPKLQAFPGGLRKWQAIPACQGKLAVFTNSPPSPLPAPRQAAKRLGSPTCVAAYEIYHAMHIVHSPVASFLGCPRHAATSTQHGRFTHVSRICLTVLSGCAVCAERSNYSRDTIIISWLVVSVASATSLTISIWRQRPTLICRFFAKYA